MFGISSSGKESIAHSVERMFDILAFSLLGYTPKLKDKSYLLLKQVPKFSLMYLFLQAMNNKEPNHFEKDVIRSIILSSFGYIEALKNKTSSNVVEGIDAIVKEAKANNTRVTPEQVSEIFSEEMTKAKGHMKLIAEAESTKTRNVGHTMEIVSKAKEIGIEDPSVFFIVVRDSSLCSECLRLHMMPDGVTPRVWKLSELSHSWHKRGDDRPSSCGLHPHCRCTETLLYPGWGFKNGYVSFISPSYDEYASQHE